MAEEEQRHRLVVLGAGRVGKTCLLQRQLNNKFISNYKPTVEDLHCRSFIHNGNVILADILDTAGNLEFPAMRRLSISTAQAFLLVFSVDDRDSFVQVQQLWMQIKEQRSNFLKIPLVIAANKCDLGASLQLIAMEEPEEWAQSNGISNYLVQVSAKTGENVKTIFKKLVQQESQFNASSDPITATNEAEQLLKRHCSVNSTRLNPFMNKICEKQNQDNNLSRSRSLIRRVKKVKVPRSSSNTVDDCIVQ